MLEDMADVGSHLKEELTMLRERLPEEVCENYQILEILECTHVSDSGIRRLNVSYVV